jgi:ATP-dependent Lon protease
MTDQTTFVLGAFDVVLPGELQWLRGDQLEASTRQALDGNPPEQVVLLPLDSALQLPAYAEGLPCTLCDLVLANDRGLLVRGLKGARIDRIYGTSAPYRATVALADDDDVVEAVDGARALFTALEMTAKDGNGGPSSESVRRTVGALRPLLRNVVEPKGLREHTVSTLGESLRKAAETLVARVPAERARSELEASLEKIRDKPELPETERKALLALVMDVQKRLGVYEPLLEEDLAGDIERLQRQLERAGMPAPARRLAKRELRLLRDMPEKHHDYSTYVRHLALLAELPWHPDPPKEIDLQRAEQILDERHFGMKDPKKRIVEYLAVRALGGKTRSTVLCLAGPPGVGKTTLAERIAEALGRKFVRVSLGGVHDECEVRGHRMSFLAAAPGRIIRGVNRVRSRSALVLLDEIDKMGKDNWRSPSAALLEVLDPEQNHAFEDNYVAVPFDLSDIFFVCTANQVEEILPTLRDRLEIVELDGYTMEEKVQIARQHIAGGLAEEHGFDAPLEISEELTLRCVEDYTREAGVRQLRQRLAALYRDAAVRKLKRCDEAPIDIGHVRKVLGPPRHRRQDALGSMPAGVVHGLSVGGDGGALMILEVAKLPGKGELHLTGRLGEVMREAAHVARARARLDSEGWGIDPGAWDKIDLHVHAPEAAVPKEGPSAGVASYLAMASCMRGIPIRSDLAFTGEVSLRGAVLPVGGIRAKTLAAERAGLCEVVLPEGNRADVPEGLRIGVRFVSTVAEAAEVAFAGASQT